MRCETEAHQYGPLRRARHEDASGLLAVERTCRLCGTVEIARMSEQDGRVVDRRYRYPKPGEDNDAEIQALADEAEAGYDPADLRPAPVGWTNAELLARIAEYGVTGDEAIFTAIASELSRRSLAEARARDRLIRQARDGRITLTRIDTDMDHS